MIDKRIVWDEAKNRINQTKHKICFEEVVSIFENVLSLTVNDIDHSWYEFRFITIGYNKSKKIIVVFYTENEDEIRIISARKTTRTERINYEEC